MNKKMIYSVKKICIPQNSNKAMIQGVKSRIIFLILK